MIALLANPSIHFPGFALAWASYQLIAYLDDRRPRAKPMHPSIHIWCILSLAFACAVFLSLLSTIAA